MQANINQLLLKQQLGVKALVGLLQENLENLEIWFMTKIWSWLIAWKEAKKGKEKKEENTEAAEPPGG